MVLSVRRVLADKMYISGSNMCTVNTYSTESTTVHLPCIAYSTALAVFHNYTGNYTLILMFI